MHPKRNKLGIPVFGIPVFGIPMFDIPVFDIPMFDIPVFDLLFRSGLRDKFQSLIRSKKRKFPIFSYESGSDAGFLSLVRLPALLQEENVSIERKSGGLQSRNCHLNRFSFTEAAESRKSGGLIRY